MAIQEFWVDPAVADGGAGTSSADPYGRVDLAITAASGSEAIIRLRRGRVYAPYGSIIGALWVSGKSPAGFLRIEDYGDEALPPTMFSGTNMMPGDAGWAYVGDGLWAKSISDNAGYADPIGMRLYAGASRPTGAALNRSLGTGYSFGTALARYAIAKASTQAEVLAEVGTRGTTSPRLWMYTTGAAGGNGILYVWTGSAAIDPPTYYEGITLVGANSLYDANGFGRLHGITLYNCSRVKVKGIDSIFSPSGLRVTCNATGSTDAVFEDCNAYAFGYNGISFLGISSGIVNRAVARNCKSDAVATLAEDWNFRDKTGVTWLNGVQDATSMGVYTDSCRLERVTTIDGYHSNTYIGASSGISTTINAQVVDCVGRQPGRRYGTLLSIAGLGAGQQATVTRFHGSDATTFISRTGSGKATLTSSVFKDGKQPYPAYDYTAGAGGDAVLNINSTPAIAIYKNTSVGAVEAGCLTMNNCTVMNPYGFMLTLSEFATGGAIPAGSFAANDSLFVDQTYLNDPAARTFNPGIYDKPGISWDMRDCATAGAMTLTGCYYYTGAAAAARVATTNTTTRTFAQYVTDGFLVGSVNEADPMVDSSGFLQTGSPLYHSGTHTTYKRDVTGMQFNNPPSIGAYEYTEARPSRF